MEIVQLNKGFQIRPVAYNMSQSTTTSVLTSVDVSVLQMAELNVNYIILARVTRHPVFCVRPLFCHVTYDVKFDLVESFRNIE